MQATFRPEWKSLLILVSFLVALGAISSRSEKWSDPGSLFSTSSRQKQIINAATRPVAIKLIHSALDQLTSSGHFQQLWDVSTQPDDKDDAADMPVHFHTKPYSRGNRISVDQEGDWKVRWSREDDPEMAGRMDDARWNLLAKLGTSERSRQHDDIPAVPYYERMAELDREAAAARQENQEDSVPLQNPHRAIRFVSRDEPREQPR
jgi:hypothetical protein